MSESVGIMGGTFDPIHFGHLAAAEETRIRLGLARVIFVPNGQPPHKRGYVPAPAARRYDMVVLATASNPAFEASRVEIDRSGPSYAVDTVETIGRQLGPDTRLYFIAGVDAVRQFVTWQSPERLVETCEIVAVSRPGYSLRDLDRALPSHLREHVHTLRIPAFGISSRRLRQRAAAGESLRYLTPQPVARYIAAHRLYSKC